MRRPVSVLIICLNEENYIRRCLESLSNWSWVDEILVIDGGSQDHTLEICSDPKATWAPKIRLLQRPWQGFRTQRNLALREAKNDWVLVMDADEACSPELAARIQELLSLPEGPPQKAYKVRRQEYFLGKKITAGIWNPSYQDRFFDRRGVEYINEIHEYPRFNCVPGMIHEPIEHAPDFHPEKFLYKMNKYTSIEARDRVNQGMRTNAFRMFMAFIAMFLKNYFYYGAYRDGFHGFTISLLEGISRAVRHIKIWQYQNERTQPAISLHSDSRLKR